MIHTITSQDLTHVTPLISGIRTLMRPYDQWQTIGLQKDLSMRDESTIQKCVCDSRQWQEEKNICTSNVYWGPLLDVVLCGESRLSQHQRFYFMILYTITHTWVTWHCCTMTNTWVTSHCCTVTHTWVTSHCCTMTHTWVTSHCYTITHTWVTSHCCTMTHTWVTSGPNVSPTPLALLVSRPGAATGSDHNTSAATTDEPVPE
jgi:hypothetical protein